MNLKGKNVLVTGIASNRSISYAIAKILHENGANVIVSYQNDRLKERVIKLKNQLSITTDAYQCDLSSDSEIETLKNNIINNHGNLDGIIHSAAFAPKEQLSGKYIDNITRDGFAMAHDISSYSLTAISKAFKDSLNKSSSIVTLSYIGAERVVQNYNIMGVAKASLECSVKYLADSLGEENIRVNAISAGPIKTLAAAGISGFNKILNIYEEKSPIKKNITSEEVAKVAYFLVSDLSTAVTGQTIYVDNGFNIVGY
jgi:enoyl-[acyl-carrier protein] reductase I